MTSWTRPIELACFTVRIAANRHHFVAHIHLDVTRPRTAAQTTPRPLTSTTLREAEFTLHRWRVVVTTERGKGLGAREDPARLPIRLPTHDHLAVLCFPT